VVLAGGTPSAIATDTVSTGALSLAGQIPTGHDSNTLIVPRLSAVITPARQLSASLTPARDLSATVVVVVRDLSATIAPARELVGSVSAPRTLSAVVEED
jgi:hypothetical protein